MKEGCPKRNVVGFIETKVFSKTPWEGLIPILYFSEYV